MVSLFEKLCKRTMSKFTNSFKIKEALWQLLNLSICTPQKSWHFSFESQLSRFAKTNAHLLYVGVQGCQLHLNRAKVKFGLLLLFLFPEEERKRNNEWVVFTAGRQQRPSSNVRKRNVRILFKVCESQTLVFWINSFLELHFPEKE